VKNNLNHAAFTTSLFSGQITARPNDQFNIDPIYASHAPFWCRLDLYSVPQEVIDYGVYYLLDPNQNDSSTIPEQRALAQKARCRSIL
jgi:hypothetical protein